MAASFEITHYRFAWTSSPPMALNNWIAAEDTPAGQWPMGLPFYVIFQIKNTGDAAGTPYMKLWHKRNGTKITAAVRDDGTTPLGSKRLGWATDNRDITAYGHQLTDAGTLLRAEYHNGGIVSTSDAMPSLGVGETVEVVAALELRTGELAWNDSIELLPVNTDGTPIPITPTAKPTITVAPWYVLQVTLAAKTDDAGDVNGSWETDWPYVQYDGIMRWTLPTLPRNANIQAASIVQTPYTSETAGAFPWSVQLVDAQSCPSPTTRPTAAPYASVSWSFNAPGSGAALDTARIYSANASALVQAWLRGRGKSEVPGSADYLGLHLKIDGTRVGHLTTKTADYGTGMADAPALYVAYTLPQLTVRERRQVKPPRGWVLGNDGRPIDPLMRGVEGLWLFNEGTGTIVADASGHGRHGTAIGGPAWQAGHTGWRLSFDGANDYVSAPMPVAVWAGDYTVALRVAQQPDTNYEGIFGVANAAGDGVAIRSFIGLAVDGTFNRWAQYDATLANITTTVIASDTGWHTVVGGVTGVKTYISRDASTPVLSVGSLLTRTAPATTCAIGASVSSVGSLLYAVCQIDYCAIWSRALSAAEIKRLHDAPPWLLR